jgi:hypothetical protein
MLTDNLPPTTSCQIPRIGARIPPTSARELQEAFVKLKWGFNRKLGKSANIEAEISAIRDKYQLPLTHRLIVFHLSKYKSETYNGAGSVIKKTEEEIHNKLDAQMDMSDDDFAIFIIRGMIPVMTEHSEHADNDVDFFDQYANSSSFWIDLLADVLNKSELVKVCSDICKSYATISAECFGSSDEVISRCKFSSQVAYLT